MLSFLPPLLMSLGKTLSPKMLLMAEPLVCEFGCMSSWWAGCHFVEKSAALSVNVCVCEWVNADLCCKSALRGQKSRKCNINAVHLLFTIVGGQWLHVGGGAEETGQFWKEIYEGRMGVWKHWCFYRAVKWVGLLWESWGFPDRGYTFTICAVFVLLIWNIWSSRTLNW